MHPSPLLLLLFATLAAVAGCSSDERLAPTDAGPSEDATADAATDGRATDAPPIMGEDASLDDAAVGRRDAAPRPEDVLVYAHSRDTLYSFSPDTLKVTEIGRFRFSDGRDAPYMLDLAVDGDSKVLTSSEEALFRVDPDTAEVTKVGDFGLEGENEQLFALSFLHEGAHREGEETLVGATNEGIYYEVDPETAETTYMGRYPDGWSSSGDIVSVEELGTFATVRREDSTSDVLVEMTFHPDGSSEADVRGPIVEGDREFVQIFGLGFWGRALYGFTNAGELIRIDRSSGDAELVSEDTGAEQFWGAGVTTVAPVLI